MPIKDPPSNPAPRDNGIPPANEDETVVGVATPLDEDFDSDTRSEEEVVESGKENEGNGRDGCNEDDKLDWTEATDPS